MTPFTPDELKSIQDVVDYAEKHRFTKADLYAIMAGASLCPGDDPNLAYHLNNGIRMAFSFEEHPMGWCRHLSISDSNNPLWEVSPSIVAHVAKAFGFQGVDPYKVETLMENTKVWFEDAWLPTLGPVKAVNVIQEEKP